MATKDYRLANGVKVPGVTSVIGNNLGWSKNAIAYWAWEQGKAGLDFRTTKDDAADLGTLVHSLIESEMRGTSPPTIPLEMKEKAENSLLGFYEWRDAFTLESTGSEVALVSEIYMYGGTIDYPALVQGRRVILDLKTSKAVYPDHRIQLAAYGRLWDESNPDDPITGYHLLQVGKEDGSFHHHYWPSLGDEWLCFLNLIALERLRKQVGR